MATLPPIFYGRVIRAVQLDPPSSATNGPNHRIFDVGIEDETQALDALRQSFPELEQGWRLEPGERLPRTTVQGLELAPGQVKERKIGNSPSSK
jgi:hypothetical protein